MSDRTYSILDTALKMVRNIGFESVSINSLAKEVGMSKSGLFAHFNSKEKMHIMILDYAAELFSEKVYRKALKEKRGLPRLKAVMKNWATWNTSEEGGGACPFIAASIEYDRKPGEVKSVLKKHMRDLINTLTTSVEHCIEEGDFRNDVDAEQVAFELYSLITGHLVFHN